MAVNQQNSNQALGRNEYVGSFAKGIEVLKALGASENSLSLGELATTTGLTRASVRRYALTLVHLKVAEQTDEGFILLPGAIGQLHTVNHEMVVLQKAFVTHATRMITTFREASSFGVRQGQHIEIMRYVKANRLMSMQLKPGDRLPLFFSAQGRAIVSQMPKEEIEELIMGHKAAAHLREKIYATREQGFAFLDGEMEEGIRSIALPIRSPSNNHVMAAISLCAHSNRMSAQQMLDEGLTTLKETVKRIVSEVAYS